MWEASTVDFWHILLNCCCCVAVSAAGGVSEYIDFYITLSLHYTVINLV